MARDPEILFVDDEDSIRLTLPLMLETFGFKVSTAASVTEALRMMTERKFDVLISDMNIERAGDGFTVVNAMRAAQPSAVRFILTGYPAIETALQAVLVWRDAVPATRPGALLFHRLLALRGA